MRARREPKNKAINFLNRYLRNHKRCFFTCSPRPPTLSQSHMDLHVWAYRATRLYIPSFTEIRSGVSEPQGVNIWPFPLLWLVAFTTPCTTVQAVKIQFRPWLRPGPRCGSLRRSQTSIVNCIGRGIPLPIPYPLTPLASRSRRLRCRGLVP